MNATAKWREDRAPRVPYPYWIAFFQPNDGAGWVESWATALPGYSHPDLLLVVGPVDPEASS